ncbi:MAG TPA: hypothetical protein VFO86_02480 [Terriglobia bacterium]|nr:hypothetical protein [Terriglobia bacterium]
MIRKLVAPFFLFALVVLASLVAFAQNAQRGTQTGNAGTTASKTFDSHDLSGFWDITNTGLPRGALNQTSNNRPQMTPWAMEKFKKTKTGTANALSNGAFPNEKDWNDPIRWCDPTGFPRVMWSPTPAGMRFAQTNEEVIQFFQNNRAWRDIWTDGRKLPNTDTADSLWYGYAVGRWEGDTFVVSSNGFIDTTWLDQYGSPHSDEMTVEERYRRVDRNHLEMTMNITDPKAYVGTWKGDKKIFQLVEKPAHDFPEDICVWSEAKRPVLQ